MHRDPIIWRARRAAELELWTDGHAAAVSELAASDLSDPAVLRALATRAEDLAACARRLSALRGDQLAVEQSVRELLDDLDV